METKTCSKCKEEKNVCDFYRNGDSHDGLRSNCKKCQNKNSENWRKNNQEKSDDIKKKFLKKNPGRLYEYNKKWRDKNKDKIRNYQSKKNKERYNNDILFNRYRRLGRPKTKIVLPLSNEYKGEIYRCEFNNI